MTGATPGARRPRDLVPDLFETGAERLPSSGQLSAASLVGLVLFLLELLVAPLVFIITLAVSALTWWLLDQPWSGRRRRAPRRRRITSRSLYLSTLMLVGMWLAVMFIFRASDPTLSAGFTTTLPMQMFGLDISTLQSLNGMQAVRSNAPLAAPPSGIAPFSLFAHGIGSTLAISLLTYAVVTGRRRLRRRRRHDEVARERAGHTSRPA